MAKHVIHISELGASSHFAALLARLRAGEEIVIEDDSRPVAVVHPAEPLRRTISQSIALAEAHAKESGYESMLDPNFAADLEDIIKTLRCDARREVTVSSFVQRTNLVTGLSHQPTR